MRSRVRVRLMTVSAVAASVASALTAAPSSAAAATPTAPKISRMSFTAFGAQLVKQRRPELEIFGTGLTGATTVHFGGVSTPALAVADKHLWVDLPVHSAGTVHVVIDTDHGSSAKTAASTFVYKARPTIDAVTPDHAKETGGATVTLTGSHLAPVVSVQFVDSDGQVAAKVLHSGTDKLSVRMPKLITGGKGSILVTTKWGTRSVGFTIDWNPPRELVSVSPDRADVSGRNNVTLRGNLGDVVGVYFGAKKGKLVSDDGSGSMVVSAPKHAAGTVRLKVVNTDGTVPHKKGVGTFTYRHDGKPVITTSALPSATVGVGYLAALHTADDRGGAWSGQLPDGLQFSPGNVAGVATIEGTLTSASGAVQVHVTFTDKDGEHVTRTLSIDTLPQRWRPDSGSLGLPACAGTTCYRIGGSSHTQLEVYTESGGGSWTLAQEVPAPAEIGSFDGYALNDFECGSPTTCTAVGVDDTDDNNPNASPDAAFAVTLYNGTWTAAQLPTDDQIDSAACTDEVCYAVGPSGPAVHPGSDAPDLLTFRAGSWVLSHPSISSAGLTGLDLAAIGCTADGTCRAAGVGRDAQRMTLGVVKVASNGTTTAAALPRPAGATGELRLTGIGCMSTTNCIALAHYGTVTGPGAAPGTPYYVRLGNARWTAHAFSTPAGAKKGSAQIASLACNMTSQCFAVGSARQDSTHEAYVARSPRERARRSCRTSRTGRPMSAPCRLRRAPRTATATPAGRTTTPCSRAIVSRRSSRSRIWREAQPAPPCSV